MMMGEERLRIGLRLHTASLGNAREAIRNQFPNADNVRTEGMRQRIRVGNKVESMSKIDS